MLWLLLSLCTALAASAQDVWIKKYFSDLTPYEMAAVPVLFSIPFFVGFFPFVSVPSLDRVFYISVIAALPINAVAVVLYMTAIKLSPLSLTVPYLAFTPAFMILTGAVILGEMPNFWGLAGIAATCTGSYVLNLDGSNRNAMGPLTAVFRETGSWIMLIVAFLFSIAAVIGKKGILHSSPMFFTVTFFTAFSVMLVPLLVAFGRVRLPVFRQRAGRGLIVGAILFGHAVLHGFAISMVMAAYMIAIKRLSVLFSVAFGGMLFQETHMRPRFLGAVLMVSGAALIILMG